jgi:hypothetical protein
MAISIGPTDCANVDRMPHRQTTELNDVREEAYAPLADRLLRNRRGILIAAALTFAALSVLTASVFG